MPEKGKKGACSAWTYKDTVPLKTRAFSRILAHRLCFSVLQSIL